MLVTSFNRLEKGSVFCGRYRIKRPLGAGAMGAVYEVVDEKTQSRRALKVMQPDLVRDPVHRERFVQEARITGTIESDHLVRVLDAGVDTTSGIPFLTMELLRGETLSTELERRRLLPAADVKRHLQQISFALIKTHAAGIVHRDLKPDNLFVTTRDDGSPCIKILDFGIAKVVSQGQRQLGSVTQVGTPLYMAPEQLGGKGTIGPQTDIHALGHLAYEMLVGEPYWAEELSSGEGIIAFFQKILAGPDEPPSARAKRRCTVVLPPGFDTWFARAAAPKPEDRFSGIVEFVDAFGQIFADKPAWMARTVAAGPLITVFDAPGDAPVDSSDSATLRIPETGSGKQAERDFDAATTIPRPRKRAARKVPWAVLGAVAVAFVLMLLVMWNACSGTIEETSPSIVPAPSSSTPVVVESVSPPSVASVVPPSSLAPVVPSASATPTTEPSPKPGPTTTQTPRPPPISRPPKPRDPQKRPGRPD
jgi:eukaryotic-like serine/threonine-protein kinase